ncbi:MAG TPA: SOS response-associated peptidase [Cyclobacteriaceae bacterium]|nr:SOS response-associated peptidase [Cyclobacteriaceae bacterium]
MCYYTSQHKEIKEIKAAFNLPVKNEALFEQAYQLNGFAKPYLPVISTGDSKAIDMYRWGLVPFWVKDESTFKANTLNARSEELFDKPSYRNSWDKRCLVICTGFFEPHYPEGSKKSQSFYIKPREAEFFTLGGIWSKWKDIYTFSIVMVEANPLLAEIHNDKKRMPLILEGEQAEAWLLPDLTKPEMTDLMKPYPHEEKLIAYRVLDGVTNSRIDTNVPEVIEPFKMNFK